jgi:negative regulator of flagellin synthesis FlgM
MTVNLKSIDLSGGTAASSTRKTSATQSPSTQSGEAAQQSGGSEVNITSTASLLARLQQTLAAQPAVDQKRVDAISKAIAQGSYTVHADKIARGLITTERSLGRLTEK